MSIGTPAVGEFMGSNLSMLTKLLNSFIIASNYTYYTLGLEVYWQLRRL